METKTYNGWTNYETWAVALWINNDQSTQQMWHNRAMRALSEAKPSDVWTQPQAAQYGLADELKSGADEDNPLTEDGVQPSVYTDLLGAALSEVNWNEIARHLIEAVQETNEHNA